MEERTGKYWRERFQQMEKAQHDKSARKVQEIYEQFERIRTVIDVKINAWYQRFADNNGVSMQEARKMLDAGELKEFRWNVQDYISYGKKNAVSGAWMTQLENASARVHISRLEALKIETQQELEKLCGGCANTIESCINEAYTSNFYHTAFEIQKGIGVGITMNGLDPKIVEEIVSKPWAVDGKNFSDRLWENKTKLINNVYNSLSRMCITGEAPDRAIAEISKQMGVSKSQAGRIVMTETAAFASKARQDCMKELDVEQFKVVETLDTNTCELCGEMDGKHFPMSEFEVGVTAPPFHPNCRGCTCPYSDDEFDSVGMRAARGADGKTYYVPANMTYKEWKESFVNNNEYYLDITNEWSSKKRQNGAFQILDKYTVDGETYIVDGKHVVSDYSEKEKNIAELLLNEFGGTVQMVPRIVYPQGKSTPDYIYNGEKYDLKEPIGESKNVLYNMVAKKKTQASNFIFDITNCPLTEIDIITQIEGLYKSKHTRFIDKVILIKNQKAIGVYKRK